MNLDLRNKYIIVAGGLGGIGLQTVNDLIQEGAHVSILTQDLSKYEKHSEKLDCHLVNYESENSIKDIFELLFLKKEPTGFISFVGTGRSSNEPFQEEKELMKMWKINYFANRLLVKYFVEITKKKFNKNLDKKYFITLTSSIASDSFINCPTEYAAAKVALVRLCKDLSWKLAPNYRVNCISPGNIFFEGGTWDKIKKEGKVDIENLLETKVPARRLGTPADISKLAVFLSSPLSSFINGSCIKIDGGQSNHI